MNTTVNSLPSSGNALTYSYDLSARLFLPETLYARRLDQRWVIFAPDYPGFPTVVTERVYGLLERFRGGRTAAEVLSQEDDLGNAASLIGFLEEKGFLRGQPIMLPYPSPQNTTQKPSSFEVWVHVTNRCNLACSYCFVGPKSFEVMAEEVIERVVKSIVKTALLHGVEQVSIKFAGGEPTLALPQMMKLRSLLECKLGEYKIPLHVSVLSNGTIMSKGLISFLKLPNTGIGISVDGFGDAHDTFRIFTSSGRGSWEVIKKNIQMLTENGVRPLIMATLSRETCGSLPQLVKWIYENRFRSRLSVVRQPNCNWTSGSASRMREYEDHCRAMQEAFEEAFVVLEDPSVCLDLRTDLNICELYFDQPTRGLPCGIGLSHLVIKTDGTMVACPMTVQDKGMEISDDLLLTCRRCFSQSPSDRLYEPEADPCLKCKWFPVCSGGCPITNLRINGHPFSRSPLCDFYSYIIPRYIEFFGKKIIQAETRLRLGRNEEQGSSLETSAAR